MSEIYLSDLPLTEPEVKHLHDLGIYTLADFRLYRKLWPVYCPLCQSVADRVDLAFVD